MRWGLARLGLGVPSSCGELALPRGRPSLTCSPTRELSVHARPSLAGETQEGSEAAVRYFCASDCKSRISH